jgi:tyrosinase
MFLKQIIQSEAAKIAATYTSNIKDQYVNAAKVLRQPFWDWASNMTPPAEIITLDQVEYVAPSGKTEKMDNPFRRYKFQTTPSSFPDAYKAWTQTLRHPDGTGADAKENLTELQEYAYELFIRRNPRSEHNFQGL